MAFQQRAVVVALSLTLLLLVVSPLCTAEHVLYSGESLKTGQSLSWASYNFIMQKDCNLVLYDTGKPVWASNTGGLASNCYVTLQSDANLVIYTTNNKAVWSSRTNRAKDHYILLLQKDRNVVIYGPAIYATNTDVGVNGAILITSNASIMEGFLPANATTQYGSNAAGIGMVVNNV